MSNEKLMDRIKKLLELSKNNSSAEEAQSALLKARELAIKYGLEISEVEMDEVPKKEVVDEAVTEFGKILWYYSSLANVIANNFRCKSYVNHGTYGSRLSRICFIGLKQDVDMARQLFAYALYQLDYLTTVYIRKKKRTSIVLTDDVTMANDFKRGFIIGLNDKFKEQENREGWGLILVKDEAVLEAIEKKGLVSRKPTSAKSGSREAYTDGYKQGKEFAY